MANGDATAAAGAGRPGGPTTYTPPPLLFTRRLGFRLGILVLVAVAPLALLVVHTSLGERDAAVRAAGDEAQRLARLAARGQEEAFAQASRLLEVIAASPVVAAGSDTDREVWLKDLLGKSPGWVDFHLVRADGSLAASALPLEESKALGDPNVLDRVRKTRAPAVGDFRKGGPGLPTAYLARPAGADLVLGGTLGLGWLERFQKSLRLPEGSVLDVVDPAGLNLLRLPASGPGDVGQVHPARALFAEASGRDDGVMAGEDTDGVRRYFGMAPLPTGGSKGAFLVVVGIPEAAVVAGADDGLRVNLVLAAIVLVVSLALGRFIAERFVLRRVQGIVLGMKRLAGTDLSTYRARRRVSQDPSELGDLERSFDEMARALESRARELEGGGPAG